MPAEDQLREPLLVAVWPGMGGVALSAGYYLMAKLGMHLLVEIPAGEFFDLEHIEVQNGMILTSRLPRSRLFLWVDPLQQHDLVVFIGDAQPAAKGGAFCRKLIDHAIHLGVRQVFTFAAMATPMRPRQDSRVFGAAIDRQTLATFKRLDMNILKSGNISGMNGVLLGMAAASGLPGGCLLGEIPHIFAQIPFPKASLAVLEIFSAMAEIDVDFTELRTHAKAVERTLEDFLTRMENAIKEPQAHATYPPDPEPQSVAPRPGTQSRQYVNELFEQARRDRSQAYELKQELDRLGLFGEFEDRFLDLFKEPE